MYNYQKNTNLFGNVQNFLFHLRLTEWSVFTLTLVVLNPKVIFKWRKDNNKNKKNPLQGAKVRTSCISFSLSQNSHRTTQTNAGDKGCAEACAERFSALKDQHWRHSLQSITRPFQKRFREVFGNARILIFYLSIKAWEAKSLPKSHLGCFFLVFGEGKATKENISIFWFIWPLKFGGLLLFVERDFNLSTVFGREKVVNGHQISDAKSKHSCLATDQWTL